MCVEDNNMCVNIKDSLMLWRKVAHKTDIEGLLGVLYILVNPTTRIQHISEKKIKLKHSFWDPTF